MARGYNTFRIAFLMERLAPPRSGLSGSFDATYLAALKTVCDSLGLGLEIRANYH